MNKKLLNKFLEGDAVRLRTQQEWDDFMEYLEKETDVKWLSGHKPTKYSGWFFEKNNTVVCVERNRMQHSAAVIFRAIQLKKEIIDFEELFKPEEAIGSFVETPSTIVSHDVKVIEVENDGSMFFYMKDKYGKEQIIPINEIRNTLDFIKKSLIEVNEGNKQKFTEDEKVILRNLPEQYKWIVRDEHTNILRVYEHIPSKYPEVSVWRFGGISYSLEPFKNLFQSIQWSDEEPCDFRRYL